MTKISHNAMKPYIKKDIIKEFWYTVGELNTSQLLTFLQEIFTPTEIMMLAKRLAIIRSLRKGIDYSSIRLTFKVTDTTIAKMNNILKMANGNFIKILDHLVKEENKRWELFKEKRMKSGGILGGRLIFPQKIK